MEGRRLGARALFGTLLRVSHLRYRLATQVVDPAFSKLLEGVADDASVEELATLLEAASAPTK